MMVMMMITPGNGFQYGGWCQVQWRVPSTVEGYLAVQWGAIMKYSGGSKYGGGLSCSTVDGHLAERWRAICSTVGGYHAVQWRVLSTVEGYRQYSGGCKYGGGLSSVQWRVQVRWRAIISTVEGASTVEGYHSVRWRVRSTVEALNTRYTKHEMKSYKIHYD